MCGIAGAFNYRPGIGPVDPELVVRMRDHMYSRGPDGEGLWVSADARVAFGHRRLAFLDLSPCGAQPMSAGDGAFWITFNGEIYNFWELRAELEAYGVQFHSQSDTEVLLHLYIRYGEAMCERLRGMYAFAIWDDKRKGLFLARDPFGIKPLYVYESDGRVRFASQVKAILVGGDVDTTPDPAGHCGFFLWGNMPEPYTLYRRIRELPAGHTQWIDGRGARRPREFFNLTLELQRAEEEQVAMSEENMRATLRCALLDSVRHHLIADVPVGVFLSAGLDSTTILALTTEVATASDTRTVTLAFGEFDGTENDEAPLAEKTARHYGTVHQTRRVLGREFKKDIGHVLDAMDQPSVDGINTYYVSKVTGELGLKAALSGLGGDELFGGYPSFSQVPALVRRMRGFRRLPFLGRAFRVVSAPLIRRMTSPKYAGLIEYGPTYSGAYLLRRGLFMPWELPSILPPEMVREGLRKLGTIAELDRTEAPLTDDHSKLAALEMTWYMRNRLLRDSDWAGMAHSLEIRVPLVDVSLFRSVAPYFSTPHSPTKRDMATSLANPLTPEILDRPKTGFSIPTREWIMGSDPDTAPERSLRGWARYVYRRLCEKPF